MRGGGKMSKESNAVRDEVMLAIIHATTCEECRIKMAGVMAYVGMMAMECADHARKVKA